MHKGKQYVGVLSGVGGWAGIGLAAGPDQRNAAAWHNRRRAAIGVRSKTPSANIDTAGLGAVGAYKSLSNYTSSAAS